MVEPSEKAYLDLEPFSVSFFFLVTMLWVASSPAPPMPFHSGTSALPGAPKQWSQLTTARSSETLSSDQPLLLLSCLLRCFAVVTKVSVIMRKREATFTDRRTAGQVNQSEIIQMTRLDLRAAWEGEPEWRKCIQDHRRLASSPPLTLGYVPSSWVSYTFPLQRTYPTNYTCLLTCLDPLTDCEVREYKDISCLTHLLFPQLANYRHLGVCFVLLEQEPRVSHMPGRCALSVAHP